MKKRISPDQVGLTRVYTFYLLLNTDGFCFYFKMNVLTQASADEK